MPPSPAPPKSAAIVSIPAKPHKNRSPIAMPRKKKLQGFNGTVSRACGGDWSQIRGYNNTLKRLAKRRVKRIDRTGKYKISQIAWQAAVLQQSLLYRIVALATATAKNWNQGNVLGAALPARALLETTALMNRVGDELHAFAEKEDFEGLHRHAVNLTFATRDEKMKARDHEIQAKNAMTYIKHLNKELPGIAKHYEFLCEWCHPNVFGQYGAFATFDKEARAVTFCERKMHCPEMLDAILAVYCLLDPSETMMDRWDEIIMRAAQVPSEPIPPPEGADAALTP
jgi:hypothetical protein